MPLCKAETNNIIVEELNPSIKLHLKTPYLEKDLTIPKLKNTTTDEPVFSIDPGIDFHAGGYNWYASIIQAKINLTEEKYLHLERLAFFGYKYNEHTEYKWYVITQYLIWSSLLEGEGELYFIDENNTKIEPYNAEISYIQKEVANVYTIPSFASNNYNEYIYEVKINEPFILQDTNEILSRFDIIEDSSTTTRLDKNTISITFSSLGDKVITFLRPNEPGLRISRIFKQDDSPTLFSRGIVNRPGCISQFKIIGPTLTIKVASDENHFSRANIIYNLYQDDMLLGEFTTNEEGIITIPNLSSGNYTLKNISMPNYYEANSLPQTFTINDKDVEIEEKVTPIKKVLNFQTLVAGEPNTNITYLITNIETKETYTLTDTSINLPFGTYEISQTYLPDNYTTENSLTVIIDENYHEKTYTFTNSVLPEEPEIPAEIENPELPDNSIISKPNISNDKENNPAPIEKEPLYNIPNETQGAETKPSVPEEVNNSVPKEEKPVISLEKEPVICIPTESNYPSKNEPTEEKNTENSFAQSSGEVETKPIVPDTNVSLAIADLATSSNQNQDKLIINVPSTYKDSYFVPSLVSLIIITSINMAYYEKKKYSSL